MPNIFWDEFSEQFLGPAPTFKFVIFTSYGNDSVALIQWCHEQGLKDVLCIFSDTKWAADWWMKRVENMEDWVVSLGYYATRTKSIGFVELAREKRGMPSQKFQWCSYILKIAPGREMLEAADPGKRAVCLVGVRREESVERANFPRMLLSSPNHGERVMLAPLADFTGEDRDALIRRAGVDPLPHRSMECSPCINANKEDMKALTEAEIVKVESLEKEMGFGSRLSRNGKTVGTFFRPSRHHGAAGIREVLKWAHAGHGVYGREKRAVAALADEFFDPLPSDQPEPPEESLLGCNTGYCGN